MVSTIHEFLEIYTIANISFLHINRRARARRNTLVHIPAV
jgi:hypothetical protein